MSVTIDGVPETITRSQYLGLMTAVGLDVKKLTMLEFRMDGIYATVKASDENGRDIIDAGRNEVVKHHVFIPVVDDTPTINVPTDQPPPKVRYLVVHNGPIQVGSRVRVASVPGDGSPAEWMPGLVTVVDDAPTDDTPTTTP